MAHGPIAAPIAWPRRLAGGGSSSVCAGRASSRACSQGAVGARLPACQASSPAPGLVAPLLSSLQLLPRAATLRSPVQAPFRDNVLLPD